MSLIIKANVLNLKEIQTFMIKQESFFPDRRTEEFLCSWASKIYKLATVFAAYQNEQLVGVLACYLNDFSAHKAYITYIATDDAFKGQGVASHLIRHCFHYAKENAFLSILISTNVNNQTALKLYLTHGFTHISQEGSQCLLGKSLS